MSPLEQLIKGYSKVFQLVEKCRELSIFPVEYSEMIDDYNNPYPKQKEDDSTDLTIICAEYITLCSKIPDKQKVDHCRDNKF